jgi:hypothetical protein
VQNHSKLFIYIEYWQYWFEGDQMGDLQPNFKSILVQNAATTCVARVVATTGRVNLATCFLLEGISSLAVKGFNVLIRTRLATTMVHFDLQQLDCPNDFDIL